MASISDANRTPWTGGGLSRARSVGDHDRGQGVAIVVFLLMSFVFRTGVRPRCESRR